MLKRSDLAKQFELVVQQEIINFNDSRNALLQSIRDLRESLSNVNEEHKENYALLHSDQTDVESRFLEFKKEIQDQLFRLQAQINTLSQQNDLAKNRIKSLEEDVKNCNIRNAANEKKIEEKTERIDSLKEYIESTKALITFELSSMKCKLEADMQKAKAEILNKPSEIEVLKQELFQKIDVQKIDVTAVLKELRVLRKDLMISEKKIEALFMLIEKMKKEASP